MTFKFKNIPYSLIPTQLNLIDTKPGGQYLSKLNMAILPHPILEAHVHSGFATIVGHFVNSGTAATSLLKKIGRSQCSI